TTRASAPASIAALKYCSARVQSPTDANAFPRSNNLSWVCSLRISFTFAVTRAPSLCGAHAAAPTATTTARRSIADIFRLQLAIEVPQPIHVIAGFSLGEREQHAHLFVRVLPIFDAQQMLEPHAMHPVIVRDRDAQLLRRLPGFVRQPRVATGLVASGRRLVE